MSIEPFVAEIMPWPVNFAPRGWAFCDGSVLPISQHTALFSLLGTTYGGNGKTTFALPDLRGRAPMHFGTGPGLRARPLGQRSGVEAVALSLEEMPSHDHEVRSNAGDGSVRDPGSAVYGRGGRYAPAPDGTLMDSEALTPAGAGKPHQNMQPFLVINFVIALQGVFPPRD